MEPPKNRGKTCASRIGCDRGNAQGLPLLKLFEAAMVAYGANEVKPGTKCAMGGAFRFRVCSTDSQPDDWFRRQDCTLARGRCFIGSCRPTAVADFFRIMFARPRFGLLFGAPDFLLFLRTHMTRITNFMLATLRVDEFGRGFPIVAIGSLVAFTFIDRGLSFGRGWCPRGDLLAMT